MRRRSVGKDGRWEARRAMRRLLQQDGQRRVVGLLDEEVLQMSTSLVRSATADTALQVVRRVDYMGITPTSL